MRIFLDIVQTKKNTLKIYKKTLVKKQACNLEKNTQLAYKGY